VLELEIQVPSSATRPNLIPHSATLGVRGQCLARRHLNSVQREGTGYCYIIWFIKIIILLI
jgi:hypothetical protein